MDLFPLLLRLWLLGKGEPCAALPPCSPPPDRPWPVLREAGVAEVADAAATQVLTNAKLPEKEGDFFALLADYFPCFFDIKARPAPTRPHAARSVRSVAGVLAGHCDCWEAA